MEEGNAEYAYVSIKESENLEERRSLIPRFTRFGLVLATLVVVGLYASAFLRDKVEKVAVSLEDVRPAEVDADAAIPRSRGPAQGVSEKSVGVSLKPYTWSNAALQWQRSAYHFQPEKNWMNDPDGPVFYKGWYHLFYQYNPDSAIWGNITWGHAVSQDLVHWKYLDLAMVRDQWYDINGVWTGSATILGNGSIFMIYTGSTNASVQVQNLAWPADPQDGLLRDWVKTPANPVLVPPHGIGLKDFRDPTTGWTGPDGAWRIAIGSRLGTTGICLVYSTSDFLRYELLGSMHGVADTGMWECVDFYPVAAQGEQVGLDTSANGQGTKHVLKASLDDTKNDHYALGTYDAVRNVFQPDDPAIDVGIGLRYDYGKYYASKTFYDPVKKRRVLWGWVSETDSQQADLQKGWASLQTVPRTVLLDSKTKSNLIQWPVEEVDALRSDEKSWQNIALFPGSVIPLEVSDASQLDVELEIQFPEAEEEEEELLLDDIHDCSSSGGASRRGVLGPFGLLVLADEALTEQTAVYFYITKDRDGKLRTLFCHDQSRSSLASDVLLAINGSSVPVLADENSLTLRTLIDHSIVESFAQGGRTCITSRIYPTQAINGAARLHLFNNATRAVTVSSLKVWQMQSAGIHRYND